MRACVRAGNLHTRMLGIWLQTPRRSDPLIGPPPFFPPLRSPQVGSFFWHHIPSPAEALDPLLDVWRRQPGPPPPPPPPSACTAIVTALLGHPALQLADGAAAVGASAAWRPMGGMAGANSPPSAQLRAEVAAAEGRWASQLVACQRLRAWFQM
jgi:hypothetical protein